MGDYKPCYSIFQYGDSTYKVIRYKASTVGLLASKETFETQSNDEKLKNNICRARSMVLQYALCNTWDFFFTGTIDEKKFDRFNLGCFVSSLSQFIRDQRKKYSDVFQYLLVPERHQNGAWHIHGFVKVPLSALSRFLSPAPLKLVTGDYFNWDDYSSKFGFCSLSPIRDPVACAFYILKYIGKDLSGRASDLGQHLYFHSRPLNKAQKASEIPFYDPQVEKYCTEDFDFVKTGWVFDETDWMFPFRSEYAQMPYVAPIQSVKERVEVLKREEYEPIEQLCFLNDNIGAFDL